MKNKKKVTYMLQKKGNYLLRNTTRNLKETNLKAHTANAYIQISETQRRDCWLTGARSRVGKMGEGGSKTTKS